MDEINNINDAIKFLEDKRGFTIKDVSMWKWNIKDEDIDWNFKNDTELIGYANDQLVDYNENDGDI